MPKNKNSQYQTQSHIQPITAKTDAQLALMKSLEHSAIVIATGPAGTGKTYISAATAAQRISKKTIERIILSRSNVPTGRPLGHFPGTVKDKLTPWLMPALDVLRKFLGEGQYKYCMDKDIIQLQPLETIRGRSFENSFILVDEAQNLNVDEIIAITTRLGEGSTLVLSGDPFQTDVKGENGLVWFRKFSEKYGLDIPVTEFTVDDVVRSKVVKDILVALYTEYKIQN